MAHENEDGPTYVPTVGYRWQNSVGGARKLGAEKLFWSCECVPHDDLLNVGDWEIEGNTYRRQYTLAGSNRFGDMFSGYFAVQFHPDSSVVVFVGGQ
jgi:hypothetical protein